MTNPYRILIDLLPNAPLQVGDVTAVADGIATISVPGGGVTQARGDVTPGDRVFFRDGVIHGPATALPLQVIDI